MKSKTDLVTGHKHPLNFLNWRQTNHFNPKIIPILRNYYLINTLHLSGTQTSLNVLLRRVEGSGICVYIFFRSTRCSEMHALCPWNAELTRCLNIIHTYIHTYIHTHTHTCIYIYLYLFIYLWVCVCVYVCVCNKQKKREKQKSKVH